MKIYVTFGQGHKHILNEKLFDKNCVAVFEAESPVKGRAKAFELFGKYFSGEYPEDKWNDEWMSFYPRGYIEI